MSSPISSRPRPRPLRLGFLPLTDAAPLVVAQRLGFFRRKGLDVALRREVGWATIREKIIYGELDAVQAPAPMLWATRLGLGSVPCEVLTAFVLNLHGNALTLSTKLWDAGVRDAGGLRRYLRARTGAPPLILGAVFAFSSHHLLLRRWLHSAGLRPDREVRIVIVPPGQMFRNLVAGTIDGYCAGEPWNTLAVREGVGWCPVWSAAWQPGHVEKVLMVTQRFATERPAEHAALVCALAEACAWCDEPQHREALAHLLAEAAHLNLAERVIAPALLGRFACGAGRVEPVPDFFVFHRGDANVPTPAKAAELQAELVEAGLISAASVTPDLPRELFRHDLHHAILHASDTSPILSSAPA